MTRKALQTTLLAVFAGGTILYFAMPRDTQQDKSAGPQPAESQRRESSRHQAREVEKSLPSPLEIKVEEERVLLEEKKKAFAELSKNKIPPVEPSDEASPPVDSPEEAAKKQQAYENAQQELFTHRRLFQELRQQLVEEQKNREAAAKSR